MTCTGSVSHVGCFEPVNMVGEFGRGFVVFVEIGYVLGVKMCAQLSVKRLGVMNILQSK